MKVDEGEDSAPRFTPAVLTFLRSRAMRRDEENLGPRSPAGSQFKRARRKDKERIAPAAEREKRDHWVETAAGRY